MRAFALLLLALLGCSCASQPCGDVVPSLGAGRTVISDIDDTIKDTHVRLGTTHIPNPAIVLDGLRPWHPVPGMAEVYRRYWPPFSNATLQCRGNQRGRWNYTYLSAGPCRYEKRLRRLIPVWCFPEGKIVLRAGPPVSPHDYKIRTISKILENSNGHHFVLVGDSGEYDPESYGELARRFPDRIEGIYIRVISLDPSSRYERAFCRVAKSKIHFLPADPRRSL
jgi:phosphatidate phosphatase APP1